MTQIEPRLSAFVERCDKIVARGSMKRSTLSLKLFMDGKRIDALASGVSDIGIRRLAKAERELSAFESAA